MTKTGYVSVAALAVGGALTFASSAQAGLTTVATISGCYDCGVYDTPSLVFHNISGGTLAGASILLGGYNGLNSGVKLLVTLPDLGAGDTQFFWGSLPGVSGATTAGNLAAYDYDDEWGGPGPCPPSPINSGLCALVGNFSVIFNATVSGGAFDGQKVTSVFSPDVNATGMFVGWEGLNSIGQSEDPCCDVHTGSISGTLAVITLGSTSVPEPSTWAMLLLGFGGLGFAGYRAKARSVMAA
jgi:hypothetical protein